MKKNKFKKGTKLEDAYRLGFHLGVRNTMQELAEDHALDYDMVAWLFEEKYIKDIRQRNEDHKCAQCRDLKD